jgi:hypothetical protein
MKCHDFFRALDESDLDTYEIRYLLRVWRRGQCWETIRKTEATTKGLSTASISRARRQLVEKGWLTMTEANGKIAYEVAVPNVVLVTESNSDVTTSNGVVTQGNNLVTDRRALPLIEQNEDHTIKANGAHAQCDPEAQAAIDATLALVDFWSQLIKRQPPGARTEEFVEKWFKPFNGIWISCGRDIDAAKAKVQAVRDDFLARDSAIFDPSKLPAHVQAKIDAELLPLTKRMNGDHAAAQPDENLWQRAMNYIRAGKAPDDDPPMLAAIRAVGWTNLQTATDYNARELKGRLTNAYRTATAA